MIKQATLRLSAILLYLLLLLNAISFDIRVLFDFKTVVLVLLGTTALTLSTMDKDSTWHSLRLSAAWNAMMTGYLTTFVFVFSALFQAESTTSPFPQIALSCRPMLYGFLLQLLLKPYHSLPEKETPVTASMPPNLPDISYLRTLGLSIREAEVALLILDDLTNKEIGEKLFVSEATIKKHISHIFQKLEVSNREQLKNKIRTAPLP